MDDLAAVRLSRGITSFFGELGLAVLSEFPLTNGRRADLVAVDACGEITIVEIKSSRSDFVSDRKWWEYRDFCDRFFFGVAADFPQEILPVDCGLIVADAHGAAILRPASLTPLHAARRRAQTLHIAQAACRRLMRLEIAATSLAS